MTAPPVTSRAALSVSDIAKHYGSVTALAGASFDVPAGELLTILGPSGSGKTTLLKIIAGFETADVGTIRLDGQDITAVNPATRNIGMVFQNYALFPHMTVAANIAFPLKMRGWSRPTIAERVDWALELVALPAFGNRLPAQLSGGQQQRVALARAVVFHPRLLLLDEPFGALDRKLRETMQLEVRRLQQKLGLTTVFITHDQEEALIMSDHIAVMREGRIQQIGRPRDVYIRPENRFVADFVGESNLYGGRVVTARPGMVTVAIADGLHVTARCDGVRQVGEEVGVVVRPEVPIALADDGAPADNAVLGVVVEAVYLGNAAKYRLSIAGNTELVVRWPSRPRDTLFEPGAKIKVGWSAQDTHVMPLPRAS